MVAFGSRRERDLSPLTSSCSRVSVSSSVNKVTEDEVSEPSSKRLKTNLTLSQRHAVLHCCLKNLEHDKPKHGTFEAAAKKFHCCGRAIAVIWRRCEDTTSKDLPGGDISSNISSKSGRKAELSVDELSKLIRAVPHEGRQTLCDLAAVTKIPETTLERHLKKGLFKKFNSHVKPVLMPSNKIACVNFCLSHMDEITGVLDSMHQTVHIDEKWFHTRKKQQQIHPTKDK